MAGSAPDDAAQAGLQIAHALQAAGFSHALGGALALGAHGVPRGTLDVDVNVFVPEVEVPRVIDCLQDLGVAIDKPAALAAAGRDGMFVGSWSGMRIDVFVPSIPFSDEAAAKRVLLTSADGESAWFLSAESLAVFKLMFFRPKDLADPIGGQREESHVRQLGHTLATPAGEIGDQDVGLGAVVKLRFIEDDPASRTTSAATKGRFEIASEHAACQRVACGRSGLRVEDAVDDLAHQIRCKREQVRVLRSFENRLAHRAILARTPSATHHWPQRPHRPFGGIHRREQWLDAWVTPR